MDQRRDGNQEQALGRLEKARAAELMGALLGWAKSKFHVHGLQDGVVSRARVRGGA